MDKEERYHGLDFVRAMAMLLGLVALRTGEKIEWDAKKMRVTNLHEANELVRREYRKGWVL